MLGAIVVPPLLLAHTALLRSEPAGDAHLMEAPRRLVLEFTEVVALATARVILRGPAGDTIPLAALNHTDSTRRTVVAEVIVPPRAGGHVVEWTVAGTDGHPVRGTFRFTVDTAAAGLAAPAGDTLAGPRDTGRAATGSGEGQLDASSPVYAGVRFLTLAAVLGLLGSVALGRLVVPRAPLSEYLRDAIVQATRRFGLMSAAALLLLAVGRLVLQTVALHGGWSTAAARQLVTGTTWGTGWLLQAAGALVAMGLLRARRDHPFGIAVMLGVLAVVISAPLSGHPVAVPDAALLAVALDAIHVLAVGTWLGALAVIVLAVMPATRSAPHETMRGLLVAFTPVALTGGALVLVSGAAGAWLQLGGLAPLFSSDYGRLLLIKVVLLAAVAGIGFVNWRRIVPALLSEQGASRLRRSAGLELGLAIFALVVTAVLTATTPPVGVP